MGVVGFPVRFTELLYPDPGADLETDDSVGDEEPV